MAELVSSRWSQASLSLGELLDLLAGIRLRRQIADAGLRLLPIEFRQVRHLVAELLGELDEALGQLDSGLDFLAMSNALLASSHWFCSNATTPLPSSSSNVGPGPPGRRFRGGRARRRRRRPGTRRQGPSASGAREDGGRKPPAPAAEASGACPWSRIHPRGAISNSDSSFLFGKDHTLPALLVAVVGSRGTGCGKRGLFRRGAGGADFRRRRRGGGRAHGPGDRCRQIRLPYVIVLLDDLDALHEDAGARLRPGRLGRIDRGFRDVGSVLAQLQVNRLRLSQFARRRCRSQRLAGKVDYSQDQASIDQEESRLAIGLERLPLEARGFLRPSLPVSAGALPSRSGATPLSALQGVWPSSGRCPASW